MSSSEEPEDRLPRERLESNLKTPYLADGEIWSAMLAAFASEFEELETAIQDVLAVKFVTSAEGEALERLASIFEVERRTGEPDAKFRLRVQTALRAQLSSGTISEIRETISVLLETNIENVALREPFDVEPARIDIGVFESDLNERGITADEFSTFADDLAAGGVGIETYALGTFQYVSAEEDPTVEGAERGYADVENPDKGGTYASYELE